MAPSDDRESTISRTVTAAVPRLITTSPPATLASQAASTAGALAATALADPAGKSVADDHPPVQLRLYADEDGVMHFPGFHIEAIEMLLSERNVKGIFVDTLSLDYGPSADFAVHYRWLPANKWGIENVANLESLPAAGATVMAFPMKIRNGTGGPVRIIGLLP